MNKHSSNIFVMNMMIIIYLYVLYVYYMSISKSWYQQDSKSKRVTFVAKLPNKWLSDFGHHLFLEEGSQVPKLFQQQPCFHGSSLGIRKIFCKSSALRKCTWACKSRWKDALHILRLQVQHTKTNKSCQWTKHWQKKPSEAGDYGR